MDSTAIDVSENRIVQYYKNLGYYDVEVNTETQKIDNQKLILKYLIQPNQKYLIDSITAAIESPQLARLYEENITDQIIQKGTPFEINKFEEERERLFLLFRNNGVYNFQQNSIQFTAAIDSTGKDLKIPVNIRIENIQQRINDTLVKSLIPNTKLRTSMSLLTI